MSWPACPYCRVDAVLKMTPWGRRYECPVPGCDARVGVHRNSKSHRPLGTMARSPLRRARIAVHDRFDPLWRDLGVFPSRTTAYAWLSQRLGLNSDDCHIAMFDEARCAAAIAAIDELRQTIGSGPA